MAPTSSVMNNASAAASTFIEAVTSARAQTWPPIVTIYQDTNPTQRAQDVHANENQAQLTIGHQASQAQTPAWYIDT